MKAPTEWETKILEQTKRRVANWDRLDAAEFQLFYDFDEAKKKQSRGTEAVLNALVALARRPLSRPSATECRHEEGTFDPLGHADQAGTSTRARGNGSISGWNPGKSTSARYLGATVAAIAIGAAPENGRDGTEGAAPEQLDSLRTYLREHYATQNLHNRAWMLWAASEMDGL